MWEGQPERERERDRLYDTFVRWFRLCTVPNRTFFYPGISKIILSTDKAKYVSWSHFSNFIPLCFDLLVCVSLLACVVTSQLSTIGAAKVEGLIQICFVSLSLRPSSRIRHDLSGKSDKCQGIGKSGFSWQRCCKLTRWPAKCRDFCLSCFFCGLPKSGFLPNLRSLK